MINLKSLYIYFSDRKWDNVFIAKLLAVETLLSLAIIKYVSYTEIDWIAYNEEVDAWWINGERDYMNIRGGTGPLVYPAGFLYLYRMIQYIAGGDGSDIFVAQKLFVGLYVLNTWVILILFTSVMRQNVKKIESQIIQGQAKKTDSAIDQVENMDVSHHVWSWRLAMVLCCLSKRMHSIFMLRLFNDAPAMFLLYISTLLFTQSKWKLGCVFFSLGVSIKMNILLFAPGLLLLLLQAMDNLYQTIECLAICAFVQVLLGSPFLLTYPISYLKKAFEFDRVFFYKWTVNWKFLPEDLFISKSLALILLSLHLTFLFIFAWKWLRASKKQTGHYLHISTIKKNSSLTPHYVICTMFISNYIGICFSRTLHYQFYAWYYHTIPMLLWSTSMNIPFRVIGMIAIEYSFNVYPATALSSFVLQTSHFIILMYLILMEVPQMFAKFEANIETSENNTKPKVVMF